MGTLPVRPPTNTLVPKLSPPISRRALAPGSHDSQATNATTQLTSNTNGQSAHPTPTLNPFFIFLLILIFISPPTTKSSQMTLQNLIDTLTPPPATGLRFDAATGRHIAPHFHVTEVAKVTKDFVDCGGVRRTDEYCSLQILVANDTDHRITPAKLHTILQHAAALNLAPDTDVIVEVQGDTIETHALSGTEVVDDTLVLRLAAKSTVCLAPDLCGLPTLGVIDEGCCGDTGCC